VGNKTHWVFLPNLSQAPKHSGESACLCHDSAGVAVSAFIRFKLQPIDLFDMKPFYASSLLAVLLTSVASLPVRAAVPEIECPTNQFIECTSLRGTTGIVQFAVQDLDGDALHVLWGVNGDFTKTNFVASGGTTNPVTLSLTNRFKMGTNEVTVGVTDDGTNIVVCSAEIVVRDTTPPAIHSIIATPNVLWPPNHKMRTVRVVVRAKDVCGPVTWRITDITSNEPENADGDGNTEFDWSICGNHKAFLRAERSGQGDGRIYTLNVEVSDAANNTTNRTLEVLVPHSRGRGKPSIEAVRHDDHPSDHGNSGNNGRGNGKGNGNGHGR
jgi:hypothetical protein